MTRINLHDRMADVLIDYYTRTPGTTTEITVGNTAAALPAGVLLNGTIRAKAVMISIEDAHVRYAWNATPTAAVGATPGFGHLGFKNGWITLSGANNVAGLLIVNASSGVTSTIMVTTEF